MSFPGELAFYFSNWGLSLLSHMLKLNETSCFKNELPQVQKINVAQYFVCVG